MCHRRQLGTIWSLALGCAAFPASLPAQRAQGTRDGASPCTVPALSSGQFSVDTPTVLPGHRVVNAALIVPGREVMRVFAVLGKKEREVGTAIDDVRRVTIQGQPALLRVQTVSTSAFSSVDTAFYQSATLAPISLSSRTQRRALSERFDCRRVTGWLAPVAGEQRLLDERLDQPIWDPVSLDLVLRALPLRERYTVRLPVYLADAGGKTMANARVIGLVRPKDRRGNRVDAWLVEGELNGSGFSLWIGKDSRALLGQIYTLPDGGQLKFTY